MAMASPLRGLGLAALAASLLVLCSAPSISQADEGAAIARGASASSASSTLPDTLLAGLAQHATRFEEMKRRGEFTFSGRMEEVDGDGNPVDPKEIVVRSTPTTTPGDRITKVISCTENGKDKTAETQKKATEKRDKKLKEPIGEDRGKDLHLPFLPSEQSRYVFALGERDPSNPSRVRVVFTPKVPAEGVIKGSAWVDDSAREILSMGFSFSKNPIFVDHIEVTIVFGLPTELGRAPSKVSFDGRGGFLFIHKHYRGTAILSDPHLAF
jgi:hypothetical protein